MTTLYQRSIISWKTLLFSLLLLAGITSSLSAQTVFSKRISTATDDYEEYIDGAKLGQFDIGSSDLEMTTEGNGTQIIGLRFTDITIPKGTVITKAYIQFAADEPNSEPTSLYIKGVAQGNAPPIDTVNKISNRPLTTAMTNWPNIPEWIADAVPGPIERTTDISAIVTEILARADWASGNAMMFVVGGTGKRVADSYDGSSDRAPLLYIEYGAPAPPAVVKVSSSTDDMEEYVDGVKLGQFDEASSDLEMTSEGGGNQIIGLRFNGITAPKNAVIKSAYIQFAADESHADPTNLILHGQASDNAVTFDTLNKISTRPKTTASATWNNVPAWTADAVPGAAEQTPELKAILQEIVNRAGWVAGNSAVFFVTGTGKRVADSYDGSVEHAAQLVYSYEGGGSSPSNPVVDFPLKKKEQWSYYASATVPNAAWKDKTYDDAAWQFAKAPLGYGISGVTKIDSGFTTSYFRKKVKVTEVSTLSPKLALNLNADDGAVVYINGVEVARQNMPAGAVTHTTNATKDITGTTQKVYFMYELDKSVLTTGENVVAVEVHQAAGANTDLSFDVELRESKDPIHAPGATCTGSSDAHISCFTSLIPSEQDQNLHIPSTHIFQRIWNDAAPYTVGGGVGGTNLDFTGYVPISGSSENGYLAINHETSPGGVSVLDMSFNNATHLWGVTKSQGVDFSAVVKTVRNCSGGVTPWGTVITSEEATDAGDANADGYEDIGWNVEIDPATASIKDYGTGKQKLWAMGRMDHENVAVKSDRRTVYQGEDDSRGCVYKFVAATEDNLSEGELFALKLDQPLVNNDPSGTTGTWVKIPNTTKTERNTTHDLAIAAQCTEFSGVEDVEIGTVDGKIYFTAKGNARVYSFTDNGTTIANFQTFVGGKSYTINSGEGVVAEDWGSGNDNLTFDSRGNLYVLQDGGRNHIWVVRPGHTQASPKVEIFAKIPGNAEPTGMTFSPDERFMFFSIQTPNGSNTASVKDAANQDVIFNKSTTIVVARKEALGTGATSVRETATPETFKLAAFPNPFTSELSVSFVLENTTDVEIVLVDATGNTVGAIANGTLDAGNHTVNFTRQATLASGMYFLRLVAGDTMTAIKVIAQ